MELKSIGKTAAYYPIVLIWNSSRYRGVRSSRFSEDELLNL